MKSTYDYIPKDQRKKILLLSDDIRTQSGIATIARLMVLGTSHRYNWVQMAGLINHQDKGKILDLSQATNNETGLTDASTKLYAVNGYGDPDTLRQVMGMEKPDAILHFTDPRFWIWLYEMEAEVRSTTPITYLTIWDDVPFPMWNKPFYQSCDSLFAISKQTVNIVKHVLGEENTIDIDTIEKTKSFDKKHLLTYVPHGMDDSQFFPIEPSNEEEYAKFVLFRKELLGDKKFEFVLFYNSRNIHRKHPADIMLAFKHFCDVIGKEKADKCLLLMHTQPIDDAGTDLIAVKNALCVDCNVIFSYQRYEPAKMNYLYNIADATVNISSNEGNGISSQESMMSGKPTIINVTGGLQDHLNFVDDGGKPLEFTYEWGSNHDATHTKCGAWVYPIFPSNRSLQGSPQTPYIFDDRAKIEEITEGIYYWYLAGSETRKKAGLLGRAFCLSSDGGYTQENMCNQLVRGLDATLAAWKPTKKFNLYQTKPLSFKSGGFKLKNIDKDKIESKLKEISL